MTKSEILKTNKSEGSKTIKFEGSKITKYRKNKTLQRKFIPTSKLKILRIFFLSKYSLLGINISLP